LGEGTLAEYKSVSQITLDQPHGESAGLTLKSRFDADWQTISSGLRRDLGAQVYGQWIRSISLGDFGKPHQDGSCDHEGHCVLLAIWNVAGEHMREHLEDYTLAKIASAAKGTSPWPKLHH
jgi:Rrf2 family iron-sulfur cluster assembly transcriptional regulator